MHYFKRPLQFGIRVIYFVSKSRKFLLSLTSFFLLSDARFIVIHHPSFLSAYLRFVLIPSALPACYVSHPLRLWFHNRSSLSVFLIRRNIFLKHSEPTVGAKYKLKFPYKTESLYIAAHTQRRFNHNINLTIYIVIDFKLLFTRYNLSFSFFSGKMQNKNWP